MPVIKTSVHCLAEVYMIGPKSLVVFKTTGFLLYFVQFLVQVVSVSYEIVSEVMRKLWVLELL